MDEIYISVKDSGTFQIGARVSSTSTTGTMHFEIDGNDVTGIMSAPNNGGWQTWSTVLSKNFTLTSGIHQLKFFINSAGFNINKFDIYPPNAKPSINFVYPVGGEQFAQDSIVEVEWDSQQIGSINIGFSSNGGNYWTFVQNGVDAEFGVYRWKVPKITSANCKLIVINKDNTSLFDTTKAVFSVGVINSVDNNIETLKSFSLEQNFPNPFNPSTLINYHISGVSLVIIKVYNLLGNEVKTLVNEEKPGGEYSVVWNGKDINGNNEPSGIYFYSLRADNFTAGKEDGFSKISIKF